MRTMAEILAGYPFFAGLDDEAMALVAGCATNVHLSADEFLFREGEPAERFFLVRQGRVALEVHSPGQGRIVLDTADDGDVVGWSWLVPPYRWFTRRPGGRADQRDRDRRRVPARQVRPRPGARLRAACNGSPSSCTPGCRPPGCGMLDLYATPGGSRV